MKKTIVYSIGDINMGDLIYAKVKKLSPMELDNIRWNVENYILSGRQSDLKVDLKDFYLQITGVDEADHLSYQLK